MFVLYILFIVYYILGLLYFIYIKYNQKKFLYIPNKSESIVN